MGRHGGPPFTMSGSSTASYDGTMSRSGGSGSSDPAMLRERASSSAASESYGLAMSPPPSPLQFILQYEDIEAKAIEDEYALKSTREKWISGLIYSLLSLIGLYGFMVSIKFISEGFTLVLSCSTKGAFEFASNPIAGLMIGTATTALLHSSSTVTSITVAIVGAGGMSIRQAVPIVMGANVGTCVTCMMVAFGQVRDRARFQRAMAAATVHDMYNVCSVLVMFPLELAFHPLELLSRSMSDAKTTAGAFRSPVDFIVSPVADLLIDVDKKMITKVATGERRCVQGQSFIEMGAFRDTGLSDGAVGGIVLCIGLTLLVISLMTLVNMLAKVILGPTKRALTRALDFNGYVNILAGTALTFAVHSSTAVTSTLTPLAGLGAITLEQLYPVVIGANLGTTGTALLASLVTAKSDAVAIALVHFWFNVFGIVLFYPIPITRKPILHLAKSLAYFSALWPMTAVFFLIFVFLLFPGITLGLVYMCTSSNESIVGAGYVIIALLLAHTGGFVAWYARFGGRALWYNLVERKRVDREIRKYGGNIGMPSFVDDGHYVL